MNSCDNDGTVQRDLSMMTGSPGVLFGLYKYTLLLENEAKGSVLQPFWLDEMLEVALCRKLQQDKIQIKNISAKIGDFG